MPKLLPWKPPPNAAEPPPNDRPPAKLEPEAWTFSAPPSRGALVEPLEPKCELARVVLLK